MEDEAIYTTKEVANYLGVSPSTIYRMEKRGLLSPTKTSGGQRRFSENLVRKSGTPCTIPCRITETMYKTIECI